MKNQFIVLTRSSGCETILVNLDSIKFIELRYDWDDAFIESRHDGDGAFIEPCYTNEIEIINNFG